MQSHTDSGGNCPSFLRSFIQNLLLSVHGAAGTGELTVTVTGQSLPSRTLHCRVWRTVMLDEQSLNVGKCHGEVKAGKVGRMCRGVGGTCGLKPGGWEALRDTTALQTASTALSTPQCPTMKAFSQLLGSQHLAPHLFSISGVLSVASLAWETGEGDCCEHCPHPPAPQSVFMENPCHTSSEGPEGPSKGTVPC